MLPDSTFQRHSNVGIMQPELEDLQTGREDPDPAVRSPRSMSIDEHAPFNETYSDRNGPCK